MTTAELVAAPPPLPRVSPRACSPLSASQRSAWMREQIHPGNLFYNLFRVFRFAGPLAVDRLRRALQAIVDRHDVLRATFTSREGEPVQRFGPLRCDLPVVDLAALPPGVREAVLDPCIRRVVKVPFDLAAGPLCRFRLLRLGEEDHLLVATMHHIVVDGRSLVPFAREMMAFYTGRPLPPLPLQYQDFVAWQNARLASGELEPSGRYWRERLAGALPVLDLPADRPRPALPSYRGATAVRHLGPDLTDALKALRRARSTTLFRTLLAAFLALLNRWTGETDLIVGSPLSGRTHPDLESLIGFFVNTPALRTDLSGEPTFLEVLARVHETAAEAIAHQDYPFDLVIERLNPERDLSRPPLFSVVFLQVPTAPAKQVGPVLLSQWETTVDIAPFDLSLVETERDGGILLRFNYSTDLFDRPTIERLAASFAQLLASAVARPASRVSELEILAPAEVERLLVELNRTEPARRWPGGFPAGFLGQVRERPDAVAAVCGGEHLSYAGLAARAGWWAGRLRAHGAGREARVGVLGERGSGMLATIVGILAAGAAWVPLDPAHPDARLATILADSGIALLAASGRLAGRARRLARGGARAPLVLCWDEPLSGAPGGAEPPAGWASPEGHDLANVFYTSGSTGTPKGAMIEQAGMLNHLGAKIALLGLGPASAVVQNASPGFDISVWQMLAPLLAGGRVQIAEEETATDPVLLLSWLERSQATVLETVPTLLEELLAAAGPEVELKALRFLISNAETLPVALCRRWLERFRRVPVINTYGATECSDDTTHQVFGHPPPPSSLRLSVGRPIPGVRTYVVDRSLRPLPLGCPGQIAMSGVGVGRGYLGSPERTAERFVPCPFGTAGERLYLSGDLGRWTAGGELDLLGRLDGQLKVRGHRVEPGEVEAALARHSAVRQSVVVARPDGGGGSRLVAYLVGEDLPGAGELQEFLLRTLPRTLLPERFVPLASLPLTPNGKVDRRALPAPAEPVGREGSAAPRTALEAAVAEIWQSVLGVPRVGVDDDFFDLGGHSLLAIRLAARLKARLGLEVTVRQLFLAPTVAELAAELAATGSAPARALPPIPRRPEAPYYPLSVAQSVQWFAAWMAEGDGIGARKMPEILALEGAVDRAALQAALGALVARHAALRTAFLEVAGEPAQAIREAVEAVEVPCPEADLAALAAAERTAALRRLLQEESRPFDLARPPLLRARLVRLAGESRLLLLNLPHIISDGWSEQVLLRELAELYNAFRAGRGSPLPALPLRYVDFAVWQQEQLPTPAFLAQRDFWLARFRDGAAAPLRSPVAAPRPLPGGAAVATLALSAALSRRIEQLASTRGASLFMVLMAAFKALLARWTGQTDLTVGSVLAGRSHPDLEGVVGVFINTLALRSDLSGDPSFAALLERVRRTTLEAIAHQDYPFHLWLEVLRRERRQGDYLPFAALLVLHRKPALAAFDGLAARYLLPHEVTGEVPSLGGLAHWSAGGSVLRLDAIEDEAGLRLMLSAGSARRDAELERLLGWLRAILDQVTQRPDLPLIDIQLEGGEPPPAFATVELTPAEIEELFG
jgi:amino acid adenylation domain-containing protein